MIKKWIVTLVLVASLAPFLSAAPGWISGSSEKYPSDKYLLGVGIAGGPDAARSAARAEIAKVFRMRVMQSAEDYQRSYTGVSGGKASSSKAESSTKVLTDQVLEGVEIVDTWRDAKSGISYALAVLDKPKLRSTLARQIAEQDEIIRSQLDFVDRSTNTVVSVRALNDVLKAMATKDGLVARKRVIDPVVIQDMPVGITKTEVERRKTEALDKILFMVEPDPDNRVGDSVSGRISMLGFRLVREISDLPRDASVLIIKSRTAVSPVERNNPQWKFYGWRTTIEIVDARSADEQVLVTATKEGQVSQLNDDAARNKAVMALQDATADAVEEQVKKYVFGE